jgi:hypothetical protein
MDPIHPITPRPPAVSQIAPAAPDRAAAERREQRRREQLRRERERKGSVQPAGELQAVPEEDGPRHIDVRA